MGKVIATVGIAFAMAALLSAFSVACMAATINWHGVL